MSIIRIKIIGWWLLFVLFWLLLYFSWRHRFLWVALFCAATVFLELIKPRRRSPMPAIIRTFLWLVFIAFVLTVVFHGFLFPHSAVLYLIGKIACAAPCVPVLFYRAWLDCRAFWPAQNASAELGTPRNAGSAGAPPALLS
jgi:hypothetical protein